MGRPHTTSKPFDTIGRPEAQERFTLYVVLWQRSEDPGVSRVGPVVSHHEDMVLWYLSLGKEAPVGKLIVRVWLLLGHAVYVELASLNGDLISRQPDDPLYEVLI